MSMTVSNATGDGIVETRIACSIELPDSGTSVLVDGTVCPAGGAQVTLTGSPVTIPVAPGAGSVFYLIEANLLTGGLAVVQSTVSMPSADAGSVAIFQQTLTPASTDPGLDPATSTPDTY